MSKNNAIDYSEYNEILLEFNSNVALNLMLGEHSKNLIKLQETLNISLEIFGNQIRIYGLGSRINLVGECNDMPAAYMLSDVVVSASTDPEAFGRVIIEAQAMGRLVVASGHGGAIESVIEGQTGWVVPPGEAVPLAKVLSSILDMGEGERAKFSKTAVANVKQYFSKQVMCQRVLGVYGEILKERGQT